MVLDESSLTGSQILANLGSNQATFNPKTRLNRANTIPIQEGEEDFMAAYRDSEHIIK